jgi:taurine dioxygenase
MEYTITPMTEHTGAEVRGLDLNQGVDAETRTALNRVFADHHVLVVRGQEFTPPQFIAAAQIFGEPFQHDKREMHVPGYPQIYYVSNEQAVPGKRYISGETFHTDHSNHPTPPKATMLFPVSLPSNGGDTQYVNMHQAYDDLPSETKERIDGLKAIHVYLSKYSPRELRPLSEDSARQVPPPGVHPLVRMHPENGRKALYLNPVRIESIEGMEDSEALDLVAGLMAHAVQKKYEYRHQWHYGDFVIWDNRKRHSQGQPRLRHERAPISLSSDVEGRDAGLIAKQAVALFH